MSELSKFRINGVDYDLKDATARQNSGGNVDLGVTGATVGQTVKIAAVDENGVPTAWEPVDFPSGSSGGEWKHLTKAVTTEEVIEFIITQTDDGTPFEDLNITEVVVFATGSLGTSGGYDYINVYINDVHPWYQNMNANTNINWLIRGKFIGDGNLLTQTSQNFTTYNHGHYSKRSTGLKDNKLTSVSWKCCNNSMTLASGATLEVYGR